MNDPRKISQQGRGSHKQVWAAAGYQVPVLASLTLIRKLACSYWLPGPSIGKSDLDKEAGLLSHDQKATTKPSRGELRAAELGPSSILKGSTFLLLSFHSHLSVARVHHPVTKDAKLAVPCPAAIKKLACLCLFRIIFRKKIVLYSMLLLTADTVTGH